MSVRYRQDDVFLIPVASEDFALGRIVLTLRGNILIAVYPEYVRSGDAVDVDRLSTSRPVFLVETMDGHITDGLWKVVGTWTPQTELSIPVYKVQVGLGGDFYEQHSDGTLGRQLTVNEAAQMKNQKSWSPAFVENAVQALRGIEPWQPIFDEIKIGENV